MKKYFPILMILLFGIPVVFWSKGQFLISLGDYSFPIDRLSEFRRMLFSWNLTSLGFFDFMILGFPIPYGIYLTATHLLNVSSVGSQVIWNYLLLCSIGLSVYYLVTQLIVVDNSKYSSGFLAALFFMFNAWGATGITMFIPYITFIPLILSLYIQGLSNRKPLQYAVVISLVWWFLSSFSLWNIRGFIFQWLILILYLCFYCLQNRNNVKYALSFTFTLFILYFLLNFYWFLPFILNLSSSITASSGVYDVINYTKLDSIRINSTTINYALRLLDNWSQTANFKGVAYSPWLKYYQKPLLVFIGFFPLGIALISLLYVVKNKLSHHVNFLFFFFLLIIGLYISMGSNNVFTALSAKHLPLYAMIFSAPSAHGGVFIAVSYSVLIGYGFMFISKNIKNAGGQFFILLLCVVTIMIYGYPVWSGQFIPKGNKVLGAGRYKIPLYVSNLASELNADPQNYRIFSLPYSKLGYFAYDWPPAGYNGPDPFLNILSKPQVIGTGIGMQIADTTTKNIDRKSFFRLASLLNVKYIMNKKDTNLLHIKNNTWYTVPSQSFLNSLYTDQQNISSYGQMDLIKVPDEYFLPKLYTPLHIVNVNSLNELPNLVSQKEYQTRTAIYINKQINQPPKTDKTIIEYRMISPVKYRVRIHNATGTFPLVMSESLHEGWKVYLAKPSNGKLQISYFKLIQGTIQNDNLSAGQIYETWFRKPVVEEKNHLMVNGYANSWIIDANRVCGREGNDREGGNDNYVCLKNEDGSYDFELIVEFWPQRLYYLGLAISGTTLMGCLLYVAHGYIKVFFPSHQYKMPFL